MFFAYIPYILSDAFAITIIGICIGGATTGSATDKKLDCRRLPPFTIVLFCLFMLITEILSIQLGIEIENRK